MSNLLFYGFRYKGNHYTINNYTWHNRSVRGIRISIQCKYRNTFRPDNPHIWNWKYTSWISNRKFIDTCFSLKFRGIYHCGIRNNYYARM
jgi:hypothetical protein